MKKFGNRGQGHVEVILSMVLFIGFLIFIFIFLNPAFKKKDDLNIDKIQEKVVNGISSPVGKLSVIVNGPESCYNLKEANKIYGNSFIEKKSDQRSYTIYYGSFFQIDKTGIITCDKNKDENFRFGGYTEEKIIVYEKIIDLKKQYETDYEFLKIKLAIDDFSFQVKNLDRNEVVELSVSDEKILKNIDVKSREFPIIIMNSTADISEYILNLKTWG